MKSLSLRTSLTLWFAGTATLLLAALSLALYFGLSSALHRSVDARLAARAELLVGLCDWDEKIGAVEVELTDDLIDALGDADEGRALEVWTWPGRELIFSTGTPIDEAIVEEGLAEGEPRYLDSEEATNRRVCTLIGHRDAVVADEEDDDDKPAFSVLIRLTESLEPIEARLRQVAGMLVIAAIGCAVLVTMFAAFLSKRIVSPLQRLEAAAASVRHGSASTMPRRGSNDEVDRLAAVLDSTFDSLRVSLARQAHFTSDAAHELRNPIAVIHNAAEVALRRPRTAEEYRGFLDDIAATSGRMASIVGALLVLARMDAGTVRGKFQDVDLADIVRRSVESVAGVNDRIEVSGTGPVPVRGDADLLQMMVDNLIGNALRYGGDHPVEVSVRNGNTPEVTVRDYGPGIPAEVRGRVFDRFYRVNQHEMTSNGGAGLGLSIVAEVARLHGAQCEIDEAQPGTRVTVRFLKGE